MKQYKLFLINPLTREAIVSASVTITDTQRDQLLMWGMSDGSGLRFVDDDGILYAIPASIANQGMLALEPVTDDTPSE